MLALALAKLAFLFTSIAFVSAAPSAAAAIPTPGTYKIMNVASGHYWDLLNGNQATGTPVDAHTLNTPPTANQKWELDSIPVNSFFGLRSPGASFVNAIETSTGSIIVQINSVSGQEWNITTVTGGVSICLVPSVVGCITDSGTSGSQLTILPGTGASNQAWVFQAV